MTEILVVDDSATDRTLAAGLLRSETDWTISAARDGEDALEQIRNRRPDIVLTDLQMPEVDGLELVRRVRLEWPTLPVVLMTARGSEEIAVDALRDGAASYIPKRNLTNNLVPTIQRVVFAIEESRTHGELVQCLEHGEFAFRLPHGAPLLPSMTNLLRRMVRDLGVVAEGEDVRIGMAIDEALNNAYYHGSLEVGPALKEVDYEKYTALAEERAVQPPYCNRNVDVIVRLTPDESQFIIRDEGPGFDVSCLPDPDAPMEFDRPTGRGIVIMRTFMDDVLYNDAGNEVTLIKKRSRPGT